AGARRDQPQHAAVRDDQGRRSPVEYRGERGVEAGEHRLVVLAARWTDELAAPPGREHPRPFHVDLLRRVALPVSAGSFAQARMRSDLGTEDFGRDVGRLAGAPEIG